MVQNRKYVLLLSLFFFLVLPFLSGCSRTPPVEQAAPPDEQNQPGTAKVAPPPAYVPLDDPAVRAFESGAEYLLTGKVTDELMEPLAEAVVSVYGSAPRWSPPAFEQPAPLSQRTCDQEGRFRILLDAPANIWISIRKEGYAQMDVFLPVRDPRMAARDFQLRPARAQVSGLVVDKKDQPITGAVVIANPPPFTLLADTPVLSPVGRLTDAAGKYIIEGLPEGDVSVLASARGYVEQEQLNPIRAGQTEQLNFSLASANPLSFTVKNPRGEALPFAVAAAPGQFKIAGGDRRGIIEFTVPQEQSPFECVVAADAYKSANIQVDPKAPPANVVLENRPTIKGRVLAESGAAVEGALVSVWGTGGLQGKFDGAVKTDKAGRFELPLYYPPVREIRASAPGFLDQRLAFDSKKPVPAEASLRMKKVENGIFGRVIDYRGIPVKRFVVHLREEAAQPAKPEYQRSFNVDNGRFVLTGMAPGRYTLLIQSVTSSTAEDVQVLQQDGVEIRKNFFFGEFIAQFAKPKYAK
jgi:hypothetical protein